VKIFSVIGKTLSITVLVTVSAFYTTSEAGVLVDMRGKTPEQAAVTIHVSKPGNAVNGLVTLATYDADVFISRFDFK